MAGSPLTFVTGNADKLREAAEILATPVRGVSLRLEEVQTTDLRELVRHKARAAFDHLGRPLLVEDSGLVFRAWGELPGPFTKYFERHLGLAGMVRALAPFGDDRAEAVCALGYHDGARVHHFEGRVAGRIVHPRGSGGFGWDAIFAPEGSPRTYAEMSAAEKNAGSMRRLALERLAAHLRAAPPPD